MFNIFRSNNTAKDIIDSMPKFAWKFGPSFYIDEKEYTIGELVEYVKSLIKENKDLNDILKSIEEDGTEEHNEAVKLRQENAQLQMEIEGWKAGTKGWKELYNEKADAVDELVKEVKNLRHLKEENVRLMERVNEIDNDVNRDLQDQLFTLKNEIAVLKNRNFEILKMYNGMVTQGGLKYMEAKLQIVQNNYKKCAEERDEFKHQLNAANKEIEALKSKLRDYQDKYAKSFSYEDMYKLEKEIDQLKRWKKEQLIVQSWWDKVDSYVRDHDDAPLGGIVANTCLNFLKERDELKKRVDGLSLTIDRKNFEIDDLKAEIKKLKEDIVDYVIEKGDKLDEAKETIDVLKNMKAQGFEDYDPRDFEKDDELKKTQDWNRLVHGIETEKVYVCNHCGYKIGHNTNQWGGCACCKDGLMIEKEEAVQKHPMYPIHWSGLDNTLDFRNNIKIETSTIGKPEEEKEWVCPCNKCKERRESKSVPTWEEAASDLALRVAKLEEQIKYTQKIKFKE